MNLEIRNPELEQRVREQISSGHFGGIEDLLAQALDALREKERLEPRRVLAADQGLGLFGSPEDSALLDEVVSIAYEERRRPTTPPDFQ